MTETDVIIPPNVTELKQGVGQAILIDQFTNVLGSPPPEHVLRSARQGNNVDAANRALAMFPDQLDNLGQAAERALDALLQSFNSAMDSWMSDLVGSLSGVQSVLRDIPGQYLGNLVRQAFNSEDDFRRVMELFRDLARETNH